MASALPLPGLVELSHAASEPRIDGVGHGRLGCPCCSRLGFRRIAEIFTPRRSRTSAAVSRPRFVQSSTAPPHATGPDEGSRQAKSKPAGKARASMRVAQRTRPSKSPLRDSGNEVCAKAMRSSTTDACPHSSSRIEVPWQAADCGSSASPSSPMTLSSAMSSRQSRTRSNRLYSRRATRSRKRMDMLAGGVVSPILLFPSELPPGQVCPGYRSGGPTRNRARRA